MTVTSVTVELLWIPLGAGQHVVRISGRVFETLAALVARRPACDLYHSALVVTVPEGRRRGDRASRRPSRRNDRAG